MTMTEELSIDQKFNVRIGSITDRAGNPARLDSVPTWDSSNTTALTVTAAPDGMSAVVTAGDVMADAVLVTMRADADLGEGVREIIGTLQVNVTAGEAQFVELEADVPEPK
jgi:hypothetical protein